MKTMGNNLTKQNCLPQKDLNNSLKMESVTYKNLAHIIPFDTVSEERKGWQNHSTVLIKA